MQEQTVRWFRESPRNLWAGLGAAACAGAWLAGKMRPVPLMAAAGLALALLPRRSSTGAAANRRLAPLRPGAPADQPLAEPIDSPWPEAPGTQPFVPHTRAWDDLRRAISPVAHAQSPASPIANAGGRMSPPEEEHFSLEEVEPFILEDDEPEPPPSPPSSVG